MSPFPIPSLSSPPSSCPKPIFPKPPHQNLSLTSGSRSPPLLQPHTDPMDMSLGTNPDNICNLNNQEDNNFVEREHMFDKVVTPSDVGKLNRLVIPKQHAERYFPLDSSSDEKGLLLNFEDRNGKSWRFRYSYWTSSQSYVMTKGWSRFVKENKLDAGDIVSFQRGVGELGRGRLFIDSGRRLPSSGRSFQIPNPYLAFLSPPPSSPSRWGRLYDSLPQTMPYFRPLQSHPLMNYSVSHHQELIRATGTYHGDVYLRSGAEEEAQPEAIDSLAANQAAAKTLRLFGVNMEYASGADCGPSSSSNSTCQGRAESRRKGEGSTSFDLDL